MVFEFPNILIFCFQSSVQNCNTLVIVHPAMCIVYHMFIYPFKKLNMKFGNFKSREIFVSPLLTVGHVRLPLENWPRGYKTFFMLSSTETKIYPAHKC